MVVDAQEFPCITQDLSSSLADRLAHEQAVASESPVHLRARVGRQVEALFFVLAEVVISESPCHHGLRFQGLQGPIRLHLVGQDPQQIVLHRHLGDDRDGLLLIGAQQQPGAVALGPHLDGAARLRRVEPAGAGKREIAQAKPPGGAFQSVFLPRFEGARPLLVPEDEISLGLDGQGADLMSDGDLDGAIRVGQRRRAKGEGESRGQESGQGHNSSRLRRGGGRPRCL